MSTDSRLHAAICAQAISDAQRQLGKWLSDKVNARGLETCTHNWFAREYLGTDTLSRMASVHERCRQPHACIPCWWERAAEICRDAKAVYARFLLTCANPMETRLSFVGPAHPILEAGSCVNDAISTWQSFSSTDSAFKSCAAGYVRGVSFTINHNESTLTPTVSILAVVDGPNRLPKDQWQEEWNASANGGGWTLAHYSYRRACLDDESRLFLRTLSSVGLNPLHLCEPGPNGSVFCDVQKLGAMQTAFRSRHLILFGRQLSRTFLDDE